MQIDVFANVYTNPWGVRMPEVYVVRLFAVKEHAEALQEVCRQFEENNPLWAKSRDTAQTETLGDQYDQDGGIIIRYLIHRDQYGSFKDQLKTAKMHWVG